MPCRPVPPARDKPHVARHRCWTRPGLAFVRDSLFPLPAGRQSAVRRFRLETRFRFAGMYTGNDIGRRRLYPRRRSAAWARSDFVLHQVQHPHRAEHPPSTLICAQRRFADELAATASDRSRTPSRSVRCRTGCPVATAASTTTPPNSTPTPARGLRATRASSGFRSRGSTALCGSGLASTALRPAR